MRHQTANYATQVGAARWAADLERLVFMRDSDVLADVTWPGADARAHFVIIDSRAHGPVRDYVFGTSQPRRLFRVHDTLTPFTCTALPGLRPMDRECVLPLLWTMYTGCDAESAARMLAPCMHVPPAAVRTALSHSLRDDMLHTCRAAIAGGLVDAIIDNKALESPLWRAHAAIFATRSSKWSTALRSGGQFPPHIVGSRVAVHQLVTLVYTGTLDSLRMSTAETLELARLVLETEVRGGALGVFGAVAARSHDASCILGVLDAVRASAPSETQRLADGMAGVLPWSSIAADVSGDTLMLHVQHGTLGREYADRFSTLVTCRSWKAEVERAGKTGDTRTIERICSAVLAHLSAENAAALYASLLGDAILCDDGQLPTGSALATLEACRLALLTYIARNWLRMRECAGFDALPAWCLKELSQELNVDVPVLLKERRLGATGGTADAGGTGNSVRGITSAGLGNMPEEEPPGVRPAGPIHLRAAVINRAAARAER